MSDNNSNFGLGLLAGVLSKRKKEEIILKKKEVEIGVADELRKLNDLLKEGILTQDEFNNQRKKLLG